MGSPGRQQTSPAARPHEVLEVAPELDAIEISIIKNLLVRNSKAEAFAAAGISDRHGRRLLKRLRESYDVPNTYALVATLVTSDDPNGGSGLCQVETHVATQDVIRTQTKKQAGTGTTDRD